jgi:crotonobetainyl-CoA:carnitine CoA-transferase CaiB-like acyl-CoA transferase
MERLGFGYESLHERYPRLIYCAVSGFGRTGPYADRAGFDLIAQGMSGLMSFTGAAEGQPPVKCGAPVTDIVAGTLCAMGVLAALHHRHQTGEGQMVESSLLEAGIALTYWQSAIVFAGGATPGPLGSAHPLNAPYQAFRTKDGYITLGAANQSNWLRLIEAVGAPELGDDPRFADNTTRMENRAALEEALNRIFIAKTRHEWLETLVKAGVPAGPILDVEEMHQDPQVVAREMVVGVPHSRIGSVNTLGLPVKFSSTPGGPTTGAPVLGEHTREILAEHGFSGAEVEGFIAEGAVTAP